MDITTLAAWGEFLGGIAVVVSLIYLASQIRQNSQMLRTSAASTTAHLHTSQNIVLAQNAETSRIFYAGCTNPESLAPEEQDRFTSTLGLQVQGMHQSFEFHENGIGTEASWCFTDNGMRWFATQPGFLAWWAEGGFRFMPSFRDYVDGLIREGEAAG